MKTLNNFRNYYKVIVMLLLMSCRTEDIDTELNEMNSSMGKKSPETERIISNEAHEKFIADNGLKLFTSYRVPMQSSKNAPTPEMKIKELITSNHIGQLGLNGQSIVDIYRSKINPSVWGVFVNDYKTSSILIPLPTQARAYIETGNSTIESFIPAPDKTKIILSATSIYNDTSGAFPVSKTIHYQQKNSITSSVTVTAGVNSNSNFSLNLGQAPVVGTIGTTIGLSLSVSKQTSVIKEDEFSITDQVTPTVPPNKKLYIYAVQKIQQGSMEYSVPVTFTGDVVTKQFPISHILAPAYHLQEGKSKVQKGTINYAYYLNADIYVKELGLNDPIPTLPL